MPRKSNPVDTTQDIPKWWREVYDKYTAGIAHAFLLHFNVCDYTAPESAMNLRTYLTAMLANRKIIVFYNRAEGITFPREEMEEEFRKLLELDAQKEDTALAIALGGTSGGKQPLPRDPAEALGLIEQLLTLGDVTQNSIMVIIDYAEAVVPNADMATMSPADRNVLTILRRWGTMPRIVRSGNPIFLITESLTDLHQSIRTASSKWEAVEVPLPDPETRKKYIQLKKEDSKKFEWELTPEAMANSTAGLSLVHIEDIFLRAAQEGNLTAELVLERKTSIIASEYAEVLEILEPRMGFEMIGGLEYVKRAFQTRVIDPMREGRRNQVPMGVLMTGPAGTGKTAVAEAVAREAKVNFLILNLARIYGQYVGNSERNLEKAWRAILALAPSIVFIDEVDQAMQRGGSGDFGRFQPDLQTAIGGDERHQPPREGGVPGRIQPAGPDGCRSAPAGPVRPEDPLLPAQSDGTGNDLPGDGKKILHQRIAGSSAGGRPGIGWVDRRGDRAGHGKSGFPDGNRKHGFGYGNRRSGKAHQPVDGGYRIHDQPGAQ